LIALVAAMVSTAAGDKSAVGGAGALPAGYRFVEADEFETPGQ
jgi:hypothetical protein